MCLAAAAPLQDDQTPQMRSIWACSLDHVVICGKIVGGTQRLVGHASAASDEGLVGHSAARTCSLVLEQDCQTPQRGASTLTRFSYTCVLIRILTPDS
jgi:hypothetical protein